MKLLALDGNSILNRAFYGIKLLSTKQGIYTNGIYGFLTILNRLKEETSPDAVAIAFDLPAPTFRHAQYSQYKATRKGMPEELASQMPILKELLCALGYKIVEAPGYEADDILGTLAEASKEKSFKCVIATGDRDSLQLVDDEITVLLAATKAGRAETTLYNKEKIMEEYGVTPKQLIDIKALMGDSSDNVPGVAGIGKIGAAKLIQQFGSIENIYQSIDTLPVNEGTREKLKAGRDMAFLSYRLCTICTDAPIPLDIEAYLPKEPKTAEVASIMTKLEFFSLMDKMGITAQEAQKNGKKNTPPQTTEAIFEENLDNLLGHLLSFGRADLLAHFEEGKLSVLALAADKLILVNAQTPGFWAFLDKLFGSDIPIRTHDAKPLYSQMLSRGLTPKAVAFDTALAAYILNPSAKAYIILRLAQEYEVPLPEIKNIPGELIDFTLSLSSLPRLCDELYHRLNENLQLPLLEEIELPLSLVLAHMEHHGFAVDSAKLSQYGQMLQDKTEQLEKSIYNLVGYEFNLNSPKQLGVALFEKLGLPVRKKLKTGYSTDAEVLESLMDEHPVIELLLEYRSLSKLKSTYADGLQKVIAKDGRIHTSFNQTETRTGRISSTEPNLQNIPVRHEMGREMRKFFKAKPGWTLIDADYSQIELRVLAHIADDKTMIEAFKNKEDIHTITASQVFGLPAPMITPLMRSRAKAVNFGIVYGISAFSLSKDISVSRAEADKYIKTYLEKYSGVRTYMDNIKEQAKKDGFVETMFRRRRYLPELKSSNFTIRSAGERIALNTPIQGTAADIIKIAMIKVHNRLKAENLNARLILQVHDELIVEAPGDEAERAARIVKEEMERAAPLSVPLTADVNIGDTWYDAKG